MEMKALFDSLDAIETIEMLQRPRLFARRRLYRNRLDFFTKYDEKDFFIRFRLSKQNVLFLLEKIEQHLEYHDNLIFCFANLLITDIVAR